MAAFQLTYLQFGQFKHGIQIQMLWQLKI